MTDGRQETQKGEEMNFATRRELIDYVTEQLHAEDFLSKAKKSGYVCPKCGNGTGESGTGIVRNKKPGRENTFYCSRCDQPYDDFQLYAMTKCGTDAHPRGEEFNAALQSAADYLGLGVNVRDIKTDSQAAIKTKQAQQTAKREAMKKEEAEPIAKMFPAWPSWAQAIGRSDYLQKRGISDETIASFPSGSIGYAENISYNGEPGYQGIRKGIVFITSPTSFEIRSDDPNADKKNRYRKYGNAHLWNVGALESGRPVYIVEGIIDALSISEVGGEAVGLSSADNLPILIDAIKRGSRPPCIIDALDNDRKGRDASEDLRKFAQENGIPYYYGREVMRGQHDANDALLNDPAGFRGAVARVEIRAKQTYTHAPISERLAGIMYENSTDRIFSSTGFPNLDAVLAGGLRDGLYIIGAVSSLGKTTFCLQMADAIAKQGRDVLYFSLEMPDRHLVDKSVSRYTFAESRSLYDDDRAASSADEILDGSKYRKYGRDRLNAINAAFHRYGEEVAPRLYIMEGRKSVEEIRKHVDKHIEQTTRIPAVIIDYMQMMIQPDVRASDKQNTDTNVTELKAISRDNSIPVICISSFNRDNYKTEVNMSSYKESGGLEYSSDVLIGLQFFGMEERPKDTDALRRDRMKVIKRMNAEIKDAGGALHVTASILKNRMGNTGTAYFNFYSKYNTFDPATVERLRDWRREEYEASERYKTEEAAFEKSLEESADAAGNATGRRLTKRESKAADDISRLKPQGRRPRKMENRNPGKVVPMNPPGKKG